MRLALLVCLVLGLTAPAAHAVTRVEFNQTAPDQAADVNIRDTDGIDDFITVVQVADGYLVSRVGGGLAPAVLPCTGGGDVVHCPFAPSISADLAGGNDTLSAFGVTNPMQIAGGTGNDRLTGGDGADVLAGGPGND